MRNNKRYGAGKNSMETSALFSRTGDSISGIGQLAAMKDIKYDDLILGNGPDGVYSMDPRKSKANNNVLCVAGTNGGKTTSVGEPNILHSENRSLVVLLTKRRLMDQYREPLKRRGYDVKILDLVHPERSDVGYDPMLHINDESDIVGLAKGLVFASGCTSAREPYWENSAADLFTAFVKLAQLLYGENARMENVLERIRQIDVEPCGYDEDEECDDCEEDEAMVPIGECCPAEQFEAFKDADPQMFMNWYQYYENATNTKACIRSMMVSAMNGVMTKKIQQVMAKEEQLDFTDLVNRKTALFILTSPVNPALHPFANLVLGSMFKELFEYAESLPSGRLPIPLMAICDDFATGGQIPNFQQLISIFREKGISVMMLIQSLSQLEAMYGYNGALTIMDNSDNLVYMGGNDLNTADQIARRINKPVDEVLSLQIGQEYLFRRGQKPKQLQRYQLFDDPLYRKEIALKEAGESGNMAEDGEVGFNTV